MVSIGERDQFKNNKMNYIPAKERAKVIRTALAKQFGHNNVSVKKGRGTASSWVDARIEVERPTDCTCIFTDKYWNGETALKPYRSEPYCVACKNAHNTAHDLVSRLSNEAMKQAGYEHSTFTSDDGYNSEYSEYIIQISVK